MVDANGALRVDTYYVEHPAYGNVGSYVHEVDEHNGVTKIVSQLHVEVHVLGASVFRQNTAQEETVRGHRLITLHSVNEVNGESTDVRGQAQKDRFLLTSPFGTTSAKLGIAPFDLWSLQKIGSFPAIKAGRIDTIDVSGGEEQSLDLDGRSVATRHFHIVTQTEPQIWDVWVDDEGTPVKFQFDRKGTPIAFVLESSSGPSSRKTNHVARNRDAQRQQ